MFLDILHTVPVSGAYREYRFGHSGVCTWVRVTDDQGDQWVGVFGNGQVNSAPSAFPFVNERHAFVLAGGQGYVIDVDSRTVVFQTTANWLQQAIAVPGVDRVVACGGTELYGFTQAGEQWRSARVALDDIHLDRVLGSRVEGKVWQVDGWHAFTLECTTWTYRQGPFLARDWGTFPAPTVTST